MDENEGILSRARAALASSALIDLHQYPVELAYRDGVLTVEGEVESVKAKKLALEAVAALEGVTGVVDRLRVVPAERMSDSRIRALLADALQQEPAFAEFRLEGREQGRTSVVLRDPPSARGAIDFEVGDGVVTLNGRVRGLDEKRLAGVLAWWVPGSRDVINRLAVEPEEEDGDEKITEAVVLVLDKDPFVDATQLRVKTEGRTVLLQGALRSDGARSMAENDAWYVFGVDRVLNRIEIRP